MIRQLLPAWLGQRHLRVPLWVFLVLAALSVVLSPKLFTQNGLAGAIAVVAPLILCTLALTPIVMSGRGSVDLSIGPLMGFVNVTLVTLLPKWNIDHPVLVFAWALSVGALYQLLFALIVLYVRVAPIIVALSGFLVLTGINLLIMPRAGGVAPEWMLSWGAGLEILSPITGMVLAALVLWALVRCNLFHTHLRMTGSDERMAYSAGVEVDKVRILAHALGGAFAGLAGVCYTALVSSGDPTQGSNYTLQAVTALVLGGASLNGGRGGATGAMLGAVNMFLISNILGAFNFEAISGPATKLVFGVILIVSLLVNVLLARRAGA